MMILEASKASWGIFFKCLNHDNFKSLEILSWVLYYISSLSTMFTFRNQTTEKYLSPHVDIV